MATDSEGVILAEPLLLSAPQSRLEQLPEDPLLRVISFLNSPYLVGACRCAGSRWLHKVADNPRLWLRLQLPTYSRALRDTLYAAVGKLDKLAVRARGDEFRAEWRKVSVVLEALTRGAGATTLADAWCSALSGVGCSTQQDVKLLAGLNNDLVVRSAYASVRGDRVNVRVKDRRITAMATPFAAALYQPSQAGSDDAVVLLVVDLSTAPAAACGSEAMAAKEIKAMVAARLSHLGLHGANTLPKLLVGCKADVRHSSKPFTAMHAVAQSLGLPYVECAAYCAPDRTEEATEEEDGPKKYQWQDVHGEWRDYPDEVSEALADTSRKEAYQYKAGNGGEYEVDPIDLMQRNLKTGFMRPVRILKRGAAPGETVQVDHLDCPVEEPEYSEANLTAQPHAGAAHVFRLAVAMAAGLDELYAHPGDNSNADYAQQRHKVEVETPAMFGGFLQELKAKAEAKESASVGGPWHPDGTIS